VYCWHALPGYWGGVSLDAPAMKALAPFLHLPQPSPFLREIEPSMLWDPSFLGGVGALRPEKALGMYQVLSSLACMQVRFGGYAFQFEVDCALVFVRLFFFLFLILLLLVPLLFVCLFVCCCCCLAFCFAFCLLRACTRTWRSPAWTA
jgi:hypothetical protein